MIRPALVVAAATALAVGAGCGKTPRGAHAETEPASAAAAPTPDTTPNAALRTPAGWLLVKGERTPATPTPAPSAAPGGKS